jgi:hypothetical protein
MNYDRILQASEQAFANRVEELFEEQRTQAIKRYGDARKLKYLIGEAPVIEFKYAAADDGIIAMLKPMICRALARRRQFRLEPNHPWAPTLPLCFDDCREMGFDASSSIRRVGRYATSLYVSLWDPAHPLFDDYYNEIGTTYCWHEDENIAKLKQFLLQLMAGITATEERCQYAVEHEGGRW